MKILKLAISRIELKGKHACIIFVKSVCAVSVLFDQVYFLVKVKDLNLLNVNYNNSFFNIRVTLVCVSVRFFSNLIFELLTFPE